MNSKVWGHRGCRGAGSPPENSLAAFQVALDAGAGGIELDVWLAKDHVPVVFHDEILERMTRASGRLGELKSDELRKLPLLNREGKTSKETIPTLKEVLDLVEGSHKLPCFVVNIEVKDPSAVADVAALVMDRINSGWKADNFLISSFDMPALRAIKPLLPGVPIGALFDCKTQDMPKKIAQIADLQPATINIPSHSLTIGVCESIRGMGAMPVVWTPQEPDPRKLSRTERDKIIRTLREQEMVMITDFPEEWLQLLKPSRSRATATGVLAACLAINQQSMLFRPTESGLETLRPPSEYPELSRFGFRELSIKAEDGVSFLVWEKNGRRNQPHFLLFHGNRAHWGDTGAGDPQRDRRARLKFVEHLAAAGAGVTAVTLRGFGRSSGVPCEAGFLLDLKAIVNYLAQQGLNPNTLVVAGESLGTWAATQTAVYLTEKHAAPAVLSLQNPFTSMAEVGEDVVSRLPVVRSLQLALSAGSLDRVLKSHFYTANLFARLSDSTVIHIATSGRDGLVHPSHSERLAQIARAKNLRVVRDLFADAYHHNIAPIEYAQKLLRLTSGFVYPIDTYSDRVFV